LLILLVSSRKIDRKFRELQNILMMNTTVLYIKLNISSKLREGTFSMK